MCIRDRRSLERGVELEESKIMVVVPHEQLHLVQTGCHLYVQRPPDNPKEGKGAHTRNKHM